jgi:hypothetical protein
VPLAAVVYGDECVDGVKNETMCFEISPGEKLWFRQIVRTSNL